MDSTPQIIYLFIILLYLMIYDLLAFQILVQNFNNIYMLLIINITTEL